MAIIDPEGLFHGDRLAQCSDLARLYWPYLFIGANGYARMELSYKSIVSKIFGNFKKPPERKKLLAIFREYEKYFLAVLYEADGVYWCQFITSQKYLPRFKTKRDEESPAPSFERMEAMRRGYIQWKASNHLTDQLFPEFSENFGRRGEGVGVGDGVGGGVGEVKAKAKTTGLTPSSKSKDDSDLSPAEKRLRADFVKRMFFFYCAALERDPKRYTLTDKRKEKAHLRIRERLKVHNGDLAKVEAEIVKCIENLAASEYHRAGNYIDWENQIFRSAEEFQKRLNWKPMDGAYDKRNSFDRHVRSEQSVRDHHARHASDDEGNQGPSLGDVLNARKNTNRRDGQDVSARAIGLNDRSGGAVSGIDRERDPVLAEPGAAKRVTGNTVA